jgi:predicted metal-dependent peptidase
MSITRYLSVLLLKQPYYGYIASSLKPEKNTAVKDLAIHTGTTLRLLYNPRWLEEETENFILGKLIHEILHLILMHASRRGNRSLSLWAIACDLAVNERISPILLPEEAVSVDLINRFFNAGLEAGRGAEYYYDGLAGLEDALPFTLRQGEVSLHLPSEQECVIPLLSEEFTSEVNKNALKSLLEELTCQAAAEGEIPGELGEDVRDLYKAADINWRNVLKKFLSGKGRIVRTKTIKKVSRRFADQPGNRRTRGLEALIAIDESGSVSDEDIRTFYRELQKIHRITKADLRVLRFDTECSPPVPLDRYIKVKDRIKRGGTDFKPVFREAARTGARLLIVFTDGDGRFPEKTDRSVLWVLTGRGNKKMPFGETVAFAGGF